MPWNPAQIGAFGAALAHRSLSGAALILLTALIRAAAVEKLPKGTFRVLWGLALARLLLPVSLALPVPVSLPVSFSLPVSIAIPGSIAVPGSAAISGSAAFPVPVSPPVSTPLPVPGSPSVSTPLPVPGSPSVSTPLPAAVPFPALSVESAPFLWFAVWLAGLSILSLFFALSCLRILPALRRGVPVADETAAAWLARRRLLRPISIRQSDGIASPLTFGVLRPVILMPASTDWTDWETLRFVLYHEFIHIRRFDAAAKWILAAALCVHWFNPLVWLLYALANRDMELACDEAVIRHFGRDARLPYVTALLNMEERRTGPVSVRFSERAAEERIRAIMKTCRPSPARYLCACLVTVLAAALFAVSGAASPAYADASGAASPVNADAPGAVPETEGTGGTETETGRLLRLEDYPAAGETENSASIGTPRRLLIAEMPVNGAVLRYYQTLDRYDFRGYGITYELGISLAGQGEQEETLLFYRGDAPPEHVLYHAETDTVSFEIEPVDGGAVRREGKQIHVGEFRERMESLSRMFGPFPGEAS